jgi:hypothetical protein
MTSVASLTQVCTDTASAVLTFFPCVLSSLVAASQSL